MNIHSSQLLWCEQMGIGVLTCGYMNNIHCDNMDDIPEI